MDFLIFRQCHPFLIIDERMVKNILDLNRLDRIGINWGLLGFNRYMLTVSGVMQPVPPGLSTLFY
jgi:hypothetical protein